MPPVYWLIQFTDVYVGKPNGYLVWTDNTLSTVQGIYFSDGTVVPNDPPYGYTTIDTSPATPAWG